MISSDFSRAMIAKFAALSLAALFVQAGPKAVAGPTHELALSFALLPEHPSAGTLVPGPNGYLWGTTDSGGAYGYGAIYKAKADGTDWQTVLSFSGTGSTNKGTKPVAGLVSDGAGSFWGTTQKGGAADFGTVFKVDAATGVLTTLVEFTATATPNQGPNSYGGLVSDGAGYFWGTTRIGGVLNLGTIFKVNASTGAFTTVLEFSNAGATNGQYPQAGMVNDGAGNLWGTTSSGGAGGFGTVFKVKVSTNVLTTVVQFDNTTFKGSSPVAGLTTDGAGFFWGTTSAGGDNGFGTIFKVNATTNALTTVVHFTDTGTTNKGRAPIAPLLRDSTGLFWGTTSSLNAPSGYGTVFKLDPTTNVLTTVVQLGYGSAPYKGAYPSAGLYSDGAGSIYGTTPSGGAQALGTVFRINAGTNAFTTLVEFIYGASVNRSRAPLSGLVSDGAGALWGTTSNGGAFGRGTIYKLDPVSGAPTTVIEFTGNGGANSGTSPYAGLISDGTGSFWGTTQQGGAGYGTVFKVDATTGILTTVVSFSNNGGSNKGSYPAAGLVSDGGGFFWGTTGNGGSAGNFGTVFKVNAATSLLTTIQTFTGSSGVAKGANPYSPLVSDGAGSFWGTTHIGGAAGFGTVFKINATTSALTTVLEFNGTGGASNVGENPWGAMVSDGAGSMWGTTQAGGASGFGTIFKVNVSSNALTTVAEFTGNAGLKPGSSPAALVNDGAGKLWGTSQLGGASAVGTVFNVVTATEVLTTVVQFTGVGAQPVAGSNPGYGALLKAADGNFYGTTQAGGPGGGGTVFRLRFGPTPLTLAATSVTSTTAVLNATANPNSDGNTTVNFEYGTSPTFVGAVQSSSTTILNGSTAGPAAIAISALAPGTTYYYRVRASNAGNTVPQVGAAASFTTVVNPPPVGGTFSFTPTAAAQQGDTLHLSAPGWTDPQTPLTYQFFRDTVSLGAASTAATLDVAAPAPGAYTLRVRVSDAAGSFTEATQPLVVNAGVASWRQSYFGITLNSGAAADSADPNRNGISNLLEYALNGNPTAVTPGVGLLPVASLSPSRKIQFSFTRYLDRTDLTLTVSVADSVTGPWTALASSVGAVAFVASAPGAAVAETGTGNSRLVTVTDFVVIPDLAHPRRYLRLVVTH